LSGEEPKTLLANGNPKIKIDSINERRKNECKNIGRKYWVRRSITLMLES